MIDLAKDLPDVEKAAETPKGKGKGKGRAQEFGSGDRDKAVEVWKDRVKGILYELVDAIAEKP
jgi:hypothetical protein